MSAFEFVDRLGLADDAAQLPGDRPRPRLEGRVGQDLVGLHRQRRAGEGEREEERADHSAATAAAGARRAGAPTRRRRSVRLATPPSAIRSAPPQIQFANGLM